MGSAFNTAQTLVKAFLEDEEQCLNYVSYCMLFFGVISFALLQVFPSPYGRHGSSKWGFLVNGKFAWFIQELPSFLVPVTLLITTKCPEIDNATNKVLLFMFLLHYFQRTFIFPFLIRGGKPTPFIPFSMALSFCLTNGYLQGRALTSFMHYPANWISDVRFYIGALMFFIGLGINLHSDHILRNLRKPGETGYKIPQGGMFEFVSGANFLGESIEWAGYALASWSLPSAAFAAFTFLNLAPRAMQHHRWYKQKFEDYPKDRTAIVPYVF